jgi:ABC-type transport system involved in Fe-S cluster assembly fused permease/ATPase subunit
MAPEYGPTNVQSTAMDILNYAHAPTVGFYFLGAAAFAMIVLQRPEPLPRKRQFLASVLSITLLATYLMEVSFYLIRSLSSKYQAPHPAVSNCLGSILVWSPLSAAITKAGSVHWHPYFGAFALELVSNTVFLFSSGLGATSGIRAPDGPFIFCVFRTLISFALVADWFSIRLGRKPELHTDEEGRSLLGGHENGTGVAKNNVGYGAIALDADTTAEGEDADEEEGKDHDKDIKEQQAKRLEEAGGWIGYLRGFAIFLPHLWPSNDRLMMLCLIVRGVNLVIVRFLNVLSPRQLGIITNKLAAGTTVMPWTDIGLWTFYTWIKGYAGFGIVDNLADMVIRNKSHARITLMAYKHVMNLSMDFHTNKSTGEVLKAVEQASSLNVIIETLLFQVMPIVLDLGIAIWYVTHLFDTYMAFIVLFMAGVYVWFGIYFTTWNRHRRRSYVEKHRAEAQVVNETLHNWHTVFYFNRAAHEQTRYSKAIWKAIHAQYRYYFGSIGGYALQDIIMSAGFTSCCIFAISQIISGRRPVGNLVTFMMYWDTMMSPLHMMAYSWRVLSNSLIDAERLLQLLNTKPTVDDAKDAKPLVVDAGKVEFKDIDFGYDERKQIIKGVNMTAEGGHTIAFVGETGGGKSTLLKLLSRAYDVTGGAILIDGQDIRSVTRSSLRDAMGLVPQDPELFNTSIRENIRYGRLEATNADIEDACRAAAVHDAIVEFPDGYNSKVGERGVKLSGGQLQRIAIARVLLRNPKIVLLDEATSAVDSATEALIQEAFRKLSAGRTTFVIAHRLSTIVEADQILVVDKGEIAERGKHSELLEKGGKYAELWNKQTAGSVSNVASKAGSKAGSDCGDAAEMMGESLIDITPADGGAAIATGRSSSDDGEGDMKKR